MVVPIFGETILTCVPGVAVTLGLRVAAWVGGWDCPTPEWDSRKPRGQGELSSSRREAREGVPLRRTLWSHKVLRRGISGVALGNRATFIELFFNFWLEFPTVSKNLERNDL